MLIDWLVNVIYAGLLLSWQPASWALSLLEVGVFIVAAVVLMGNIREKRPFRFSADSAALAFLCCVGPIQVFAGSTVSAYQTWNATLQWLALASVYVMAKTLLAPRAARARFLSNQLWAGSIVSVLSVILLLTTPLKIFGMFPSRYVAYGPFIYKNHFAVFIELLLPVAFYKMAFDKRRKLVYAGLFAALLACAIASLSRAGVIIAGAEIAVLLVLTAARGGLSWRALRNLGIPVVALVFLFTLIVGWEGIWSRFHEQNGFAMRKELAISTIQMIQTRPVAGYGLGTWRTVYPQFATFDIARVANEAHDDWLQWASEGGLPFALAALFFAVYVSRFAWKNLWGLGVPAVFLHCFVDYPTRNSALAALLFLFSGALASTAMEKRETDPKRDPEWQVLSVRTAEG